MRQEKEAEEMRIKIEEDEINQIIMNGTTIHKADQCTGSSI